MDKYVWVEQEVEKWLEREPKEGYYITIDKRMADCDPYIFNHLGGRFFKTNAFTHVLVKKPIEEVIKERMPTKEDIEKEYPIDHHKTTEQNNHQLSYRIGARWLRDKLLKQD